MQSITENIFYLDFPVNLWIPGSWVKSWGNPEIPGGMASMSLLSIQISNVGAILLIHSVPIVSKGDIFEMKEN